MAGRSHPARCCSTHAEESEGLAARRQRRPAGLTPPAAAARMPREVRGWRRGGRGGRPVSPRPALSPAGEPGPSPRHRLVLRRGLALTPGRAASLHAERSEGLAASRLPLRPVLSPSKKFAPNLLTNKSKNKMRCNLFICKQKILRVGAKKFSRVGVKEIGSLQHSVFPGGHPSKY